MEFLIHILLLFIVINTVLKLSFWKWWQAGLFSFVCGLFIIAMYPYSILQSKTQLHDYLSDIPVLQNMAVLVTIESAICFAFCYAALSAGERLTGGGAPGHAPGKGRKWYNRLLYWYPSLLIFPVLFYLLTQAIFSFSGMSFSLTAYVLAGAVVVLLPLLSYVLNYFFPEKEFRLEIHFITSLFVAILGLLTTVDTRMTYGVAQEPLNLKAIGVSVGLIVTGFLLGWAWDKMKWRIRRKRNK